MLVLGIETSCDETSAAVLEDGRRIRSNIVLSQDEIHAPYGGVVPELASREHIRSIGYVVGESLERAGVRISQVDLFAVTQGPGLIGSLLVGLSFAKGLAYWFQKPLVPVDHCEAHVHSVFLENERVPFPLLALLVSGGHTTLFLMERALTYRVVGRTRDDAAGEALDKIGKFLELGYPGGPEIDRMAEGGDPRAFSFAIPHMTDRSLDYSFSGLKTAALRIIKTEGITKGHSKFRDFLASFEEAVVRALLANLKRAITKFKPKSLILCGGVACNRRLRGAFAHMTRRLGLPGFFPSPKLCTDNAAMVAALGFDRYQAEKPATFPLDLNAYPRK